MAVKLAWNKVEQFADGNGVPYSGARLFTYVGGSVGAKQTTYTESTGSTPNANPIVLDSAGRVPQPVWLTTGVSYKFVLAPSTDTDPPSSPIWTLDGVTGINDSTTVVNEWVTGPAPTFVSATSFALVGDQTTNFAKSRRVKATVTAGTVYGTITNSAFAALTTVTVALDSGNLDSGLSAVSYGVIAPVNPSIDADQVHRKGAAVASAATTDIWSVVGDYVHVTGTAAITSFATAPYPGVQRVVIFDGAATLTHNATTLQLPGGANITTAAGDRAVVRADTTANMVVVAYIKANGRAVVTTSPTQPTKQIFTSGSGTYTTPANTTRIRVRMVGGGGGGGAAHNITPTAGGNGGNTTFSTFTAGGGTGGQKGDGAATAGGGAGGTASGGDVNIAGGAGTGSGAPLDSAGGSGGASAFGGNGGGGQPVNSSGTAGATNSGGGGGGAGGSSGAFGGGGGGSGAYVESWINAPSATYSYAVGAAGAAGTSAADSGGAGGSGIIIVEEWYD